MGTGGRTIDPMIRHLDNQGGILTECHHAGAQSDLSLLLCRLTLNLTTPGRHRMTRPITPTVLQAEPGSLTPTSQIPGVEGPAREET